MVSGSSSCLAERCGPSSGDHDRGVGRILAIISKSIKQQETVRADNASVRSTIDEMKIVRVAEETFVGMEHVKLAALFGCPVTVKMHTFASSQEIIDHEITPPRFEHFTFTQNDQMKSKRKLATEVSREKTWRVLLLLKIVVKVRERCLAVAWHLVLRAVAVAVLSVA